MSRTATPCDLIPDAHCVLGTVLRPFSIGHHLILHRIGSPFTGAPDADPTPEELALAVFVCGAAYSETITAIFRGEWEASFHAWSKQLKPRWYQPTRFNSEAELEKFAAYLADGYRKPPVWKHLLAAGIEFSAPWECLLQCRLVAGGFQLADVQEMYLPAVWYYYHTLAEMEQADSLNDASRWRKTFYTEQDEAALYPKQRN